MQSTTLTMYGFNNQPLFTRVWDECSSPKGVLLIVHGMQEHSERYSDFANYLNKNNFVVVATDLRAHGNNCQDIADLGHTDTDLFSEIVSDQVKLLEDLQKEYDLPIHVLGHSYGSFVVQKVIQISSVWTSAVLSGSAYSKSAAVMAGKVVANLTAMLKGKHAHAKLVEKLSFGTYKKKFADGMWLSRDSKVCKDYYEDKFCGTPFPAGFYQSMFANMLTLPHGFENISKNKPILIIAGGSDPVGSSGKLPKKLHEKFLNKQLNSTLKIFPEARHEVLNETNKAEVYAFILEFLSKKRILIK